MNPETWFIIARWTGVGLIVVAVLLVILAATKGPHYFGLIGVVLAAVGIATAGFTNGQLSDLRFNNMVITDLKTVHDDHIQVTSTDRESHAVAFNILKTDGAVQIHCDGTLVRNADNKWRIAIESLTPACQDTLKLPK